MSLHISRHFGVKFHFIPIEQKMSKCAIYNLKFQDTKFTTLDLATNLPGPE